MSEHLIVERKEDMSPDGSLRLIMEGDGDMIVSVMSGSPDGGVEGLAAVQFCTSFGGGGVSPKTHKALRELMKAMAEDNRDSHEHRRGEFMGEEVLQRCAADAGLTMLALGRTLLAEFRDQCGNCGLEDCDAFLAWADSQIGDRMQELLRKHYAERADRSAAK